MANEDVAKQDIPSGLRRSVHVTSTWLKRIAEQLGHQDKQKAYHALRGVLFAMRDRLPPKEVMNLSAQLPAVIRGVFFEGYTMANKPETYRSREEFLGRVRDELAVVDEDDSEAATRAVLSFLQNQVAEGEIEDVQHLLPKSIRSLWPGE